MAVGRPPSRAGGQWSLVWDWHDLTPTGTEKVMFLMHKQTIIALLWEERFSLDVGLPYTGYFTLPDAIPGRPPWRGSASQWVKRSHSRSTTWGPLCMG